MAPVFPACIRMAIVGVGKIVRDQHAPVIAADPDFELVATASPRSTLDGVPSFRTLGELLAEGPEVDAVAVTSVSAARHAIAHEALLAGKAVFLEKPPCTALTALDHLVRTASARGVSLFASWHSRFAPQVEAARRWLAQHPPRRIEIDWREDVRRWHPDQDWIWEPGGLGVFDPGINALSILTRVAPTPLFVTDAELRVPANRQTPMSAHLSLADGAGLLASATFDWGETGPQRWEIRADTAEGTLRLFEGGARLEIAGHEVPAPSADLDHAEYAGLYRHFAELVRAQSVDADDAPLRLTADAFLLGRRTTVEPFL